MSRSADETKPKRVTHVKPFYRSEQHQDIFQITLHPKPQWTEIRTLVHNAFKDLFHCHALKYYNKEHHSFETF